MKTRFALLFAAIVPLGIGSAFGQVTASQIYNGLVSYWPMDQLNNVNGFLVTTDVVSGINLIGVGTPTTATGVYGNAITLNGTSQYLVFTNSAAGGDVNNLSTGLPYFAGTPFTLALWVKAAKPGTTTHYLFALGYTGNTVPLYCLQSGSATATEANLDVIIRQENNSPPVNHASTTNVLFDGNWHHLAWVDNDGIVSVYEDGLLETGTNAFSYFPNELIQPNAVSSTGTFPFTIPLNTTAFGALVRGNGVGGYLACTIDDAAIWNRALSQAEIQYVKNNSIAQPVPALPPAFAVPLASQTNAMGDYVVLSANACGTAPLGLQWYENGAAIPNATNQILDVFNLTASGTNVIYVTATNPSGSATNGPVNLVVLPDRAPALNVGCYGYWPLDTVTVSGTSAATPDVYDGNNFNLTNMTAANVIPGVFTNALNFANATGVATNFGYLDGVVPALSYTNYTISFWVNAPAGTLQQSGCVFGNTSSANTTTLFLMGYSDANAASSNLCVYLRSDPSGEAQINAQSQLNYVVSSNGVFDGTWHHVTWVDKGGSVTLYVDGAVDPVCFSYIRTNANPTLRSNQTWTVTSECLANRWAAKTSIDRMNCAIDDVAYWDRALSYTEVQWLQTNPVPAQTALTFPTITAQPASITNAYTGDTDTFSVQVNGSSPLYYQWFYNSNSISPASNPTATNRSLVLSNVQSTNAGYYSVIVSNVPAPGSGFSGGGVTNSAVAQLTVQGYLPASTNVNQTVLKLEFNAAATAGNIYPGFQSMTLSTPSVVFNGMTKVTLSPLNSGILTDRDRNSNSEPNTMTNDPPALNTALLYNSFIFNDSMVLNSGIDILIQHLAPNTVYGVNLWSFDPESGGVARYSDWSEAISSTTILSPYYFNGSDQPAADYDDTFGALLMADPNGQLDIQGVEDAASAGSQFAVFINALTITANPVPVIQNTQIGPDGNLHLTALAQYSGQTLTIQESPDLINWQNEADAISITVNGPALTAVFPLSASNLFYRVSAGPWCLFASEKIPCSYRPPSGGGCMAS